MSSFQPASNLQSRLEADLQHYNTLFPTFQPFQPSYKRGEYAEIYLLRNLRRKVGEVGRINNESRTRTRYLAIPATFQPCARLEEKQ